jgi:soluble lytic murein transglycosylase-like protein
VSDSPRIKARAGRLLAAGGIALSLLLGHLFGGSSFVAAQEMSAASYGVSSAPAASATSPAVAPAVATLGTAVPASIRQWQPYILKYAQQFGVDPNLIAAIMMSESGGNPNATSSAGAVGLMQVMGGAYDPDANVRDGVQLLAASLQHYGGDLDLGVAAYNAGTAAVDAYRGIPPFLETESYVFSVLNRYYLYSSG